MRNLRRIVDSVDGVLGAYKAARSDLYDGSAKLFDSTSRGFYVRDALTAIVINEVAAVGYTLLSDAYKKPDNVIGIK
jgi:hypothetical protein